MSIRDQIKDIDQQIRNLDITRGYLHRCYTVESYEKRLGIIGKCYKRENTFYKVIDLNIDNDYRCFCLTFKKMKFNVEYIQESLQKGSESLCFTENISGLLGTIGYKLTNVMIRDLADNMEEISLEEFNKEYFNNCEKILNLDKTLLEDRLGKIKDAKKWIERDKIEKLKIERIKRCNS